MSMYDIFRILSSINCISIDGLSIDEMVGAWCFGCLSGPPAFTCWIYFALVFSFIYCWVFSYALFSFISWFICSRTWYIDKLGVIHANQISMCLDSHLNWGWGWRPETDLIPPVKYFTDHSKAVLLLWTIYVFSVLRSLCPCARLFICALWSPVGKGLTSFLSFVVSNCEFVTFPLVSCVSNGTWLYRILIFAPLLIFPKSN